MTSLNDILNTSELIDEDSIELLNHNLENKDIKIAQEPLFVIDESIPKETLPFNGIYYLDKKNVYNTRKILGEYILKQHQCTTLYYMLELEKMKYDVKTISNVPDVPILPTDTIPILPTDTIPILPTDTIPILTTDTIPILPILPTDTINITNITNHYTNIGVISDRVGAGKSYCIMALLNESKTIKFNELQYRNIDIGSSNITPKKINKLDTNILLVPHSLIGQWSKYLEKSGLKYCVIQKAKDVYNLGDKHCKFNTTNSNDNIVGVVIEEEVEVKPKKKLVLKKKLKTSDIQDSVKEGEKEGEKEGKNVEITKATKAEKVLKTKKTTNIKTNKSTIKKNLEQEKILIQQQVYTLGSQKRVLSNNPLYYTHRDIYINNIELMNERQIIVDKIKDIDIFITDLEKKISTITDTLIHYDLQNGNISNVQLQLLNNYYNIYNDSTRTEYKTVFKYIDKYLHEYNNNLSHINKSLVESYDVILVSDSFYNLLSLYFIRDDYTINRIIVDECNYIKGIQLLKIKNIFTWFVTSSINSMMTSTGIVYKRISNAQGYTNTIAEKTVLSSGFIMNTIIKLYENKDNHKLFLINNPDYIKESILLPELQIFVIVCKDNIIIKVLNGIVSPDIMRMLYAGDIDGIINKLDVVVGDESNLISIITQKYNEELLIKEYELRVSIENPKYKPDTESLGISNKRIAIKELKYKIACIEDRIKNIDSCPICLDDFVNPIITPCCNNKFCFNCITMTLNSKNNCPTCRAVVTIDKLFVVSKKKEVSSIGGIGGIGGIGKSNIIHTYEEKIDLFKKKSTDFTKYENLNTIFELNNNNTIKKYLIFTEYESTLNTKLTSILEKWNLKYDRIKGSSLTINKQIEKYRQSDNELNVLLINSKFFGSGMNLQNTADIIIMHKMQSDIEMQAIGRAQRFGREGQLRIWKLYYQNEL